MHALTLFGRRWFQRGPGNTYCTVEILIDGVQVAKIGPMYGYGDYYQQAAMEWLQANGHTPDREMYAHGGGELPWRYCERHGIKFAYSVADVRRERDL